MYPWFCALLGLALTSCSLGINFDAIEACPEGALARDGACVCPEPSVLNEALGVCECPIEGQALIDGVCACAEPLVSNEAGDACACPSELEGAGGVFSLSPGAEPRNCNASLRRLDGSIGKAARDVLDLAMLERDDGTVLVAQLERETSLAFVTVSTLAQGDTGMEIAGDEADVQIPIPAELVDEDEIFAGLELVHFPGLGATPIIAYANGQIGWVNTTGSAPVFTFIDEADFTLSPLENREELRDWNYPPSPDGERVGYIIDTFSSWQDEGRSRAVLIAQGAHVSPLGCEDDSTCPSGWTCEPAQYLSAPVQVCTTPPQPAGSCDNAMCPIGSTCQSPGRTGLNVSEASCLLLPTFTTAAIELKEASGKIVAEYRFFRTVEDGGLLSFNPLEVTFINFFGIDRVQDSTSVFTAAGASLAGRVYGPTDDPSGTCNNTEGCFRIETIAPLLTEITLDPLTLGLNLRPAEFPAAELQNLLSDARSSDVANSDLFGPVLNEVVPGLAHTGSLATGKEVWTSSAVLLGACIGESAEGFPIPVICSEAESNNHQPYPAPVGLITQWERSSSDFSWVESEVIFRNIVRGAPVDPELLGRQPGETYLFVMGAELDPDGLDVTTGLALFNPAGRTDEEAILMDYPLEFSPDFAALAQAGTLFAVPTFNAGVVIFELSENAAQP